MGCLGCQNENSETRKFGRGCGAKLIPTSSQRVFGNPPEDKYCAECGHSLAKSEHATAKPLSHESTSFTYGRYQVNKFLGEDGKKKVYLAHDTVPNRDVAFALIKTKTLDDASRERITREAQAMGRLGDHEGQLYIVLSVMSGSNVEGLIEKAPEYWPSLEQTSSMAKSVCLGPESAHSKGIIHRDLKPGNARFLTNLSQISTIWHLFWYFGNDNFNLLISMLYVGDYTNYKYWRWYHQTT